ncbi:MAG: lysylphosphatidylglycerol synthase domain-containing protein [Solirubrobacteraceae bacterium]
MSAGVLSILLAGLVFAIPDLRTVAHRLAHAQWGWVALAAGLELVSCLGYVLAFQAIFGDLPRRFAALVAAAEQAFGAVVPIGGAGGIAAGGWLLARRGLPMRSIARRGLPMRSIAERSAVLFLLTSATNVVALLIAAAGLAVGLFVGPHDLLRTVLPAVVAVSVLVIFVALARRVTRVGALRPTPTRPGALRALADTSAQTLRLIARPGWRVGIGAPAFLLCDVAVLWLAIHALGYSVPAAPLLVAYLLGYLANVIPIPGGLGVLDGGLAGALIAYHVPAAAALGGVLIYHALALWIPTVSGTLAFIVAQRELVLARERRAAVRSARTLPPTDA